MKYSCSFATNNNSGRSPFFLLLSLLTVPSLQLTNGYLPAATGLSEPSDWFI